MKELSPSCIPSISSSSSSSSCCLGWGMPRGKAPYREGRTRLVLVMARDGIPVISMRESKNFLGEDEEQGKPCLVVGQVR